MQWTREQPPLDAIAFARSLLAEGRPIDAIEHLTLVNREAPSVAIEEALVHIRHEGFAQLDRDPPQDEPEPIRAEPNAVGPITELMPHELTLTTLRSGLRKHGCVLVRGLVSPERSDALAEGIDRSLAAFDDALAGAPEQATAPWYVPFTPTPGDYRIGGRNWLRASGGVWTADAPRMLFTLLDLVEELKLGALITEFVGERPALSVNKSTLRRVPLTRYGDWHQDGAFLGRDVRSLNVWLSLSHCGRDAPGLDVVPRRLDRIVETGRQSNFEWTVSHEDVLGLADGAPVVRPEFAPGDALLFDHMFLHRTAVTPEMTRERHAIETWFFAPSVYPGGQIPLLY